MPIRQKSAKNHFATGRKTLVIMGFKQFAGHHCLAFLIRCSKILFGHSIVSPNISEWTISECTEHSDASSFQGEKQSLQVILLYLQKIMYRIRVFVWMRVGIGRLLNL